jgi:hypothetical protein
MWRMCRCADFRCANEVEYADYRCANMQMKKIKVFERLITN